MFKEFELGQVVATRGILSMVENGDIEEPYIFHLLARHANGDWGDMCASDMEENNRASVEGDRLMSSYKLSDHISVWIITEGDRSSTTVLLPSEY